MAKVKQPFDNVDDMIAGDAVKKPLQPGKPRPLVKEVGPIFLTALVALFLSIIALGFGGFAVWKNSQQGEFVPPSLLKVALSEVTEKRFAELEAKIITNAKSRQQAITALGQRFDQQVTGASVDNVDDTQAVGAGIDQRFIALEMAVKDLAAKIKSKPVDEKDTIFNNGADFAFSISPNQVSLLIVSGLLADNMAGASLDRWIDLLQGLADQGVTIPDLAKLRMVATPTPKRVFYLIRSAYDLVPQMTAALNRATNSSGFFEKARAKLGQVVQLRKIGGKNDENEAALSAFEIALAIQDLEGAVRAAGQWSGPNVPSLKKWLVAAQSRQSLDRVVSALVTDRLASAIEMQLK